VTSDEGAGRFSLVGSSEGERNDDEGTGSIKVSEGEGDGVGRGEGSDEKEVVGSIGATNVSELAVEVGAGSSEEGGEDGEGVGSGLKMFEIIELA
jgi:hypothetical protein